MHKLNFKIQEFCIVPLCQINPVTPFASFKKLFEFITDKLYFMYHALRYSLRWFDMHMVYIIWLKYIGLIYGFKYVKDLI